MVDVPLEDEMDAALRHGRGIMDANQRLIDEAGGYMDDVSRPLYMVTLVVISSLTFVVGFAAGLAMAWMG